MKKRYFLFLILGMLLIFPLKLKAYTEPSFYFLGERLTEDKAENGWFYTAENQTFVFENYHYNGRAFQGPRANYVIESNYDNVTIEIYGDNQIDIFGVDYSNITQNNHYTFSESDITFLFSDTSRLSTGNGYLQNDAHVKFIGTGTLTINIAGGNNMYGFMGNYVEIDGPTININIEGLDDWDQTPNLNETSDLLQASLLEELVVKSGKLATNCKANSLYTELVGIHAGELTVSGGELFANLDTTTPVSSAIACEGENVTVSGGKLRCDSTITTDEYMGGGNAGMSYGNTISLTGGEIIATAHDTYVNEENSGASSSGLYAVNVNVSGGKLTATAGDSKSNGALGAAHLNISGGTVIANAAHNTHGSTSRGISIHTMTKDFKVSGNPVIEASGDEAFSMAPKYATGFVPTVYAGDTTPGQLVTEITTDTYKEKYVKVTNRSEGGEEETEYPITFQYNGARRNGQDTEVRNFAPAVLTLSSEFLLNQVVVPEGLELYAIEVDGTERALGYEIEVNKAYIIKYLWRDITSTDPEGPGSQIDVLSAPIVEISKSSNAITLTINEQENATGYQVYKSTDGKKWGSAKNIDTNTYKDTGLTYGKTYYYKVKACNPGMCSDFSAVASLKLKPDTVSNVRLSSAGTNYIKVAWDKVSVTGYEVYMNGKKVTTVTKNSTLSYKKSSLKANKSYKFKVRAYKTVSGKKVYGPWSEEVTLKTAPSKPSVSVKYASYKVNRVLPKVKSGATTYKIYRSTSKKGKYTLIGTTSDTTDGYLDEGLALGKTYYYKIKACNVYGSCSGYSSIVYKKIVPDKSVVTLTSEEAKKVKVEVSKVEDSVKYEVYRSTKKSSGFKKVKTLSNLDDLSYLDSTSSGKTYYYKVRSYALVGKTKVYSSYSTVVKIKSN